ncbi:SRPBCC family protein [Aquisalinus flavus]|uniref:Polyketide cyclase / dehydrase and lipid transport n=1 Tax=Aquisalinus flavus TaxID=1526572 RepID=A0A8J2V205_9PROT|nr:SRPBCC family protein [Aquisalinus flavus]MBD0425668.1 SRPBCC family protein [Aquisalinus flavus]UNE48718.1 SRPBCC family protein [Aquisalinus flavus]GGD14211.1 hypothetical protein GCM10011342_23740 [Aquisalinus flavus]
MEFLLLTLLVLVVLVLGVYALGFFLPDHVAMRRDITINAPRETVFALIGDFNRWPVWSPWTERDPEAKYTIEGAGVGHLMAWTSEVRSVGNGSQRITAFDPPRGIESDLNFGAMGGAHAVFQLEEKGPSSTHVTWAFESSMRRGVPVLMQPVATYMGFMMEKFLGPDYEKGLAGLKRAAEEEAGDAPAPAQFTPRQTSGSAK